MSRSAINESEAEEGRGFDMSLLNQYIKEAGKYEVLSSEEQLRIAIRAKEGDKEAGQRLITSNLRLVVKIALGFRWLWKHDVLDLIQEGNIGLIKAIPKFDPYKGVKFSFYASYWIRARILKFIINNWCLVKLGTTVDQRKIFFKLSKEKKKMEEKGIEPTPELLSEKIGCSVKDIVEMDQRINVRDVSLDAPIGEDSDAERENFISDEMKSPEEQLAEREIEALVRKIAGEYKDTLTPRKRRIFEERVYADEVLSTLQELGDDFGVSRERIRCQQKDVVFKFGSFLEIADPNLFLLLKEACLGEIET